MKLVFIMRTHIVDPLKSHTRVESKFFTWPSVLQFNRRVVPEVVDNAAIDITSGFGSGPQLQRYSVAANGVIDFSRRHERFYG